MYRLYIMAIFTCYLCLKNPVYLTYFCEPCTELKRIMAVYGAQECRDILKTVCIRESPQRNYKISSLLKKEIIEGKKELKNLGDETFKKKKKDLV